MTKSAFFLALFLAVCAAGLSLLMVRSPENFGAAAVLLFPGAVIAIITSGNVHDVRAWVVAVGNFIFYFMVVYLFEIVQRRFSPLR